MEGLGVRNTFALNGLHTVSTEEGLEVEVSAESVLNERAGNGSLGRCRSGVARATPTDDTRSKLFQDSPGRDGSTHPAVRVVRSDPRGSWHRLAQSLREMWEGACPGNLSCLQPTQLGGEQPLTGSSLAMTRTRLCQFCTGREGGVWSDPTPMSLLGEASRVTSPEQGVSRYTDASGHRSLLRGAADGTSSD